MANEPIHHEYTICAHGTTTINALYTNLSASADAWVDKAEALLAASKVKIVGADVEFTPRGYRQKAAVVQLCVGQECLVYHVSCLAEDISVKFKKFLLNSFYKFADFDITEDTKKLARSHLFISNHIDIQRIWRDPDLKKVGRDDKLNGKQGMKDVAGILIDISYYEMNGGMTNNDHKLWGKAPLSQKHMDYVGKDGFVAYELFRRLDFYERGRFKVMKRSQKKRCRRW
ncbi:unnamed protein product [Alopecurus aequalis]